MGRARYAGPDRHGRERQQEERGVLPDVAQHAAAVVLDEGEFVDGAGTDPPWAANTDSA